MIGTALHSQPVYKLARARPSRVGGPEDRARVQHFNSVLGWLGSLFFDARRALSALVVCAFVVGSVMCGPAEHEWLEGNEPTVAQTVSDASGSVAQVVTNVAKTPVDQGAPAKGKVPVTCTGHCAAHFTSLPGQFAEAVVPFDVRTAWVVFNDARTMASHPPRLERPPRV